MNLFSPVICQSSNGSGSNLLQKESTALAKGRSKEIYIWNCDDGAKNFGIILDVGHKGRGQQCTHGLHHPMMGPRRVARGNSHHHHSGCVPAASQLCCHALPPGLLGGHQECCQDGATQ